MSDPVCQVCNKAQSELGQPLKRCAECLTGSYCCRDCQKADWKDHKKNCVSQTSNGSDVNMTSSGNYLDTSGEVINASYSMGCHDMHGNPLSNGIPVGQRRDRTFNPSVDSRYAEPWLAPYELLRYLPDVELTFLCRTVGDGEYALEQDTIVMEVGARKKNGVAVGARSFGKDSKYNRSSMPEIRSTHNVISRTTCIGCQNVGDIARQLPRIKRAIIMTSSQIIYNGVNQIFDWFNDGFPDNLSGGMTREDWAILHHNIKGLEDKGIAVKFWKIDLEFVIDATRSAMNRFLDLENAPVDMDPNNCTCSHCVIRKQLTELQYAKTGVACCPCDHSLALIAKNLKKGDKFVITNNAGITESTVTMEVDGTDTFRHPGT